jgi:hypothetical protein
MDGYLIVKKIKTSDGRDSGRRMLGCSNYDKNGGCTYTITEENFSSSWEKMCRNSKNYNENGKVLPIDKCVLAGYPVEDLLKIFKYVVGKLSVEKRFKFNRFSLTNFLIGKPDKGIAMYHLDEDRAYGRIDKENEKLLFAIIDSLVELGFFKITEEKYKSLAMENMDITEPFARKFFELFQH